MKRISVFILILAMTVALVGCDESHIALTQEESDAIAQYSAYLMLKYDQNKTFSRKLLDYDDYTELVSELSDEGQADIPVPVSETTPVPTEVVPTQQPTAAPQEPTEVPQQSDVTPVITDTVTPEVTPEATPTQELPTPVPEEGYNTIGECYDNKLEVQYIQSNICDSYRSDLEYFSITPPDGQKLLVVDFKLINTSSTDITFKSSDYNTVYRLYFDGKKYKEPRLTLIANDLMLLNTTIKSGESTNAVLIYFVEDADSSMTLKVSNDDISTEKSYCITIN